MRIDSILILILASFCLNACDKGNDQIINSNDPILSELVYVDITSPGTFDTIRKIMIDYDAMNRVVSKTDIEFGVSYDTTQTIRELYFYVGNDSIASKIIKVKKYFGTSVEINSDTTFFTIENFRIKSDSTRQNGRKYQVNEYTYSPSFMSVSGRIYLQPNTPQWNISSLIYQTKSNNNITYQIDTVVSQYLGSPAAIIYDRFERSLNYLSNVNPLFKVTKPIYNEYMFDEDYMFEGKYESPNLVSQDISSLRTWHVPNTGSGGYDKALNYTYTFRSDGYPTEARLEKSYTNVGVTTNTVVKILYNYR